jgi:hypothetical protein
MEPFMELSRTEVDPQPLKRRSIPSRLSSEPLFGDARHLVAFSNQFALAEMVVPTFPGCISNGAPGIPAAVLTLTDSVVNANRLSASAGLPLQGGGVYTTNGLVRTRTVIAGNKPDNCYGC